MKTKIFLFGMLLTVALLNLISCTDEEAVSPPQNLTAVVDGNTIRLSWTITGPSSSCVVQRSDGVSIASYGNYAIDHDPKNGTNSYTVSNYHNGNYATAVVSCYYSSSNNNTQPDAPTNVKATATNNGIRITWNSCSNYLYYAVARATDSDNNFYIISDMIVGTTSFIDYSPVNGNNYYLVANFYDETGENYITSEDYATCYWTGNNGGSTVTKPSAPTGVSVNNVGSAMFPEIRITWNAVSGAESYKVYRSTSANGTYSYLGTNTYTFFSDWSPKNGNNYYKVTAVNNAGESSYSSYVVYNHDPSSQISPCPVQYGNCTASGGYITLRWSNSTAYGCGTPTKAYLRVMHPDTREYVDLEELSGSATSASFAYGMWLTDDGYCYVGIITKNSAGSSGGVPKVWDENSKRWMN